MNVLFYAILIFLLYNFIVKFVIPVYRTTRQVRRHFASMKEQFQQAAPQSAPATPAKETPKAKQKEGEYIEFEEVK